MATNDFLPFAGGAGANVLDQATYAALAARTSGFSSGILLSENLNKAMRQASIMAAVLAQWIADKSGNNVLDDGTTATIEASLTAGLAALGLRAASTAQTGVVQLADSATILAGADAAKVPTAASLLAGLLGAGGNSVADYLTIPYRDKTTGARKNMIVQWGQTSLSGTTTSIAVTLPLAWPTGLIAGAGSDTGNSAYGVGIAPSGLTQIIVYAPPYITNTGALGAKSGAAVLRWLVIGN